MAKQPVIGIDIGHGSDTFPPSKGVTKGGKGYAEHSFNSLLGIKLAELLEHNGFKVVFGQKPNSPDVPLGERRDVYKAHGVDLAVSVHANYNGNTAVNGRCVFYWNTNKRTKNLAQAIVSEMKGKGYGTHGNGLHASKIGDWTNLYVTRAFPMDSILVEHGFMNGSKDFDYIFGSKQAKHIVDMADANAKAVTEHFNKSYKSKKASTSKPKASKAGTIYRVQVGAFKDVAGVAKYADEVERKTKFDTYITEIGGWLKVQVGAFADKANADKRLADVKKAGYKDAFVTTKSGKAVSSVEPYNDPVEPAPKKKAKKSWKDVAKEIYEGKGGWGVNPQRKAKLEKQGYNYNQVQEEVNRLVRSNQVKARTYSVGGRVTISNNAKTYATGENIPASIKGRTYTIQQVKSDRVLLREIVSWVRKSDVI